MPKLHQPPSSPVTPGRSALKPHGQTSSSTGTKKGVRINPDIDATVFDQDPSFLELEKQKTHALEGKSQAHGLGESERPMSAAEEHQAELERKAAQVAKAKEAGLGRVVDNKWSQLDSTRGKGKDKQGKKGTESMSKMEQDIRKHEELHAYLAHVDEQDKLEDEKLSPKQKEKKKKEKLRLAAEEVPEHEPMAEERGQAFKDHGDYQGTKYEFRPHDSITQDTRRRMKANQEELKPTEAELKEDERWTEKTGIHPAPHPRPGRLAPSSTGATLNADHAVSGQASPFKLQLPLRKNPNIGPQAPVPMLGLPRASKAKPRVQIPQLHIPLPGPKPASEHSPGGRVR
jgi:hypothetical protein